MANMDRSPYLKSDDRILVLGPVEGEAPISTSGLFDKRLFSGENKLHVYKEPQGCLWRMKYEMGAIPDDLRQAYTTFERARDHAARYFRKRNVEIKNVID